MNSIVPITMDLSPFEVLVAAVYTPFADPPGCPATTGGYKGCQRVTITLGPKQEFLQTGSDSSASYPHALANAKTSYPARTLVSGHVLNANFGGPDDPSNMTILTSSANSSQRLFDNNVGYARSTLYNIYRDIASCDPINPAFFTAIGYGIAVEIQVTGAAWTLGYPGNCISSQLTLSANVVGEAALLATFATPTDIATNFRQPRQIVFSSIHHTITSVRTYVATAMTGTPIANT